MVMVTVFIKPKLILIEIIFFVYSLCIEFTQTHTHTYVHACVYISEFKTNCVLLLGTPNPFAGDIKPFC